jgi:hypothetical protein
MMSLLPFGIASAFGEANTLRKYAVSEASFGLVILIGAWIFFITARPFRHEESFPDPESSLNHVGSGIKSDADSWNCDLPPNDSSADKADRWVLR